ncbi:VIT protein, partial [Atractosteus spatula]|nr:VIT protein [Atractosteus spatula]
MVESGLKISCSVEISGIADHTFLLKVLGFYSSSKLTDRISSQLTQPIKFEYIRGQIRDIYAAPNVSETVVNIVRGILNFLQVTVKNTHAVYQLEELGIHGFCHTSYVIEKDKKSKEIYITRSTDLRNCQEKAEKYIGLANAPKCKNCKEKGSQAEETVTYTYTMKLTDEGALITEANVQEMHQFTPFNVKGGTSLLEATKTFVLVNVKDAQGKPPKILLQNKGNLKYKFGSELNQIPLVLMKMENPEFKIAELIQRLVQANTQQIDANSTTDILKLYQVLRGSTIANLEAVWKTSSDDTNKRRWLLDSMTAISDTKIITFLKNRIRNEEITPNEAGQALLVILNKITPDSEAVEQSREFLETSFNKNHAVLWRITMLAYGSLIYRYCVNSENCPGNALQPLHDLALDALSNGNEEYMILNLKALGNAGQYASIKIIMKFLPGFASGASQLPTRVQSNAVLALRKIAIKDPKSVQDIVTKIFLDKNIHAEVRMFACLVIFEAKPSMALVSTITGYLLKESNLQVASFCYSQIEALARSVTPDNQELSIACSAAVKILRPKLAHLSYRYSKAFHFDWFHDPTLSGIAADLYMINNAASSLPTAVVYRFKSYFIQRVIQPLEIGLRAEGIQELFNRNPLSLNGRPGRIEKILQMLSGWKAIPKETPLVSGYVKFFGQEVFFADINRNMLYNSMQTLSTMAGKQNNTLKIIEDLQNGMALHWTKPYLIFETRYIQSTSLGLPAEISKYYSSMMGVFINAKANFDPVPSNHLGQLMNSNIDLQADGSISIIKDFSCFHGINTDIVQAALQFDGKANLVLPFKVNTKMNIKEGKFQIDMPPCQRENEIMSVSSQVFAISRNREDLSASKKTPVVVPDTRESERHNASSNEASRKSEKNLKEITSTNLQLKSGDKVYGTDFAQMYREEAHLCVKANTFGMEVCLETKARNAFFLNRCPFYYLLGENYIKLKLKPVPTDGTIQKISIKMNVGSDQESQRLNQMMIDALNSIKKQSSNSTRSISSSSSSSGSSKSYQKEQYGHKNRQRHRKNPSVSSSSSSSTWEPRHGQKRPHWSKSRVLRTDRNSTGSSSSSSQESVCNSLAILFSNQVSSSFYHSLYNYRKGLILMYMMMMIYSSYPGLRIELLDFRGGWSENILMKRDGRSVQVRWGEDHWKYKFAGEARYVEKCGSYPSVKAKLQWEKVPRFMKTFGEKVYEYLPGIALLLQCYQKQQQNPSHQVSVTLMPTSSAMFDVILKAPGLTVYGYTIPLPFQIPTHQQSKEEIDLKPYGCTDVDENKDECSVTGNNFKTFNNIKFTSLLPKACYHVLAQDCTNDLKFLVLMRQETPNKKEVNIRTPFGSLNIYHKGEGYLVLTLNDSPMLLSTLPLKDSSGTLLISKHGDGILVQAPTLGLRSLYFSGESVKVEIESWMRGKMCGMCGKADGEKKTEFRMPSWNTAMNPSSFVHSWILQGEVCSDVCKLQHQTVKLEKHVSLMGKESNCYSVEPVLRCRPGCSASDTVHISVRFHCVPLGRLEFYNGFSFSILHSKWLTITCG